MNLVDAAATKTPIPKNGKHQVIVNSDDGGTCASFTLDEGGLEQTDVLTWGSGLACKALLPNTAQGYFYVSNVFQS